MPLPTTELITSAARPQRPMALSSCVGSRTPPLNSRSFRCFAWCKWTQGLVQEIRLGGIAHQVGIALAAMVLNLVGADEAAVVGRQGDGLVRALSLRSARAGPPRGSGRDGR